ncbi:MAG: ABC transporter permease [Candidatus Tectomicrobia bacterium]|nr:ABC transporter permease [Candidatus Tectomicrobia bacterium]
MGITRYIIVRIFALIPVMLLVSLMIFSILHLIPGDPIDAILGEQNDPVVREALIKEFGFDKPLPFQFTLWLWKVLQGDFGISIIAQREVKYELLERLPATLYLAVIAVVLSTFFAVPLGVIAAVKRKTMSDYMAMTSALLGVSIPEFWFGILLVLLFSLKLGWLPTMGYVSPFQNFWVSLRHLVMPAVTLGWGMMAIVTRMTRSTMLDELNKDYVRTARSQGLPERTIVYKLTLKNALIPTVTIVGMRFATLLGGTVIVESLFNWPGVGLLVLQSIYFRDYPVVQASVLILATGFVVMNLLVDIIYTWLDPRVRLT